MTLAVLNEAGLVKYFDAVSTIDDAPKGKPAPDIFLYAAKKMGAPPRECVVFEDAPFGLRAAKAAGMKTVAVAGTSCHRREELLAEKPDLIVESLKDLDAAKLKNLF
jgi:beta-phosphoglucomutase-like phosphatase (HAD superfamily)